MSDSAISGVRWGSVERHVDERGSFRELWRADALARLDPALAAQRDGAGVEFVQSNLSTSSTGVLRGLHLHLRQLDYWVVASGRAFIAIVDARPMLEGDGEPIVEAKEASADTTVVIPVGVAHGFLALEPLELIYFVTTPYDGNDELGFAWDDPLPHIAWPRVNGGGPILSGRDRANPSLPTLVESIRPRWAAER